MTTESQVVNVEKMLEMLKVSMNLADWDAAIASGLIKTETLLALAVWHENPELNEFIIRKMELSYEQIIDLLASSQFEYYVTMAALDVMEEREGLSKRRMEEFALRVPDGESRCLVWKREVSTGLLSKGEISARAHVAKSSSFKQAAVYWLIQNPDCSEEDLMVFGDEANDPGVWEEILASGKLGKDATGKVLTELGDYVERLKESELNSQGEDSAYQAELSRILAEVGVLLH